MSFMLEREHSPATGVPGNIDLGYLKVRFVQLVLPFTVSKLTQTNQKKLISLIFIFEKTWYISAVLLLYSSHNQNNFFSMCNNSFKQISHELYQCINKEKVFIF